MERAADGKRVFEVRHEGRVLLVDGVGGCGRRERVNAVRPAVESGGDDATDATKCTLLQLYARLGHLAYDTASRMANAPGSGVRLTDRSRLNCLTCAQGKQSCVNKSRKDTGKNAPVDKIGGVICSDIKGPMSPQDRNGNRYLINFVNHSSNYLRVLMAKNKVEATKKFEHFLVFLRSSTTAASTCFVRTAAASTRTSKTSARRRAFADR
ncbi:hypothetical protein PF010_g11388 [Phytophthora fragariae]|uniref:GAG-pre-integrase domain-containing protein n=1 Tax=Phytophthora fragariae TaxID=53985 RepID=A0A6G0L645_9STRA|nr:hypothetical protein PF010_g11388 [Phytophthora fragariae]